jgi:hypothetical protein
MCRKTQSLQHTVSKLVPAIQFHGIPSHHSDRADTLDMGMAAVNTLSGKPLNSLRWARDYLLLWFQSLLQLSPTRSINILFGSWWAPILLPSVAHICLHSFTIAKPSISRTCHTTSSLNLSYITTGINMEKCSSILLYSMKHNMTCHWNADFKKGASFIAMDVETH